MKIARINSIKYFRESIFPQILKEPTKINHSLVKKTVKILERCILGKSNGVNTYKKYDLTQKAWNELVKLLKGKEKLDREGVACVKFIEQEIFRLASHEFEKIKYSYQGYAEYDKGEYLLQDFRLRSHKGVANTCCYLCGKILERHAPNKSLHYCTRTENPTCYKNRINLESKQKREWKLLTFKDGAFKKPYCAKCKKLITYSLEAKNYFYNELPFCCQKHMETYRKSEFRKQKKTSILSS